MKLRVRPCKLREANEYVRLAHRHHKPARGCVFCLQVEDLRGGCRGVAVVGRPVARMLDNGRVAEVTRCATRTDGSRNVCSMLYSAAARAAREMGYDRIVTYILAGEEKGVSLRAAGWELEGEAGGGPWNRDARARKDHGVEGLKLRWNKNLA